MQSRLTTKTCRLLTLFFTGWLVVQPVTATEPTGPAAEAKYPTAGSKKGLQVELVDDALALGIKHAAINVNLAQLVVPAVGEAMRLNETYLQQLDRQIGPLSQAGVLVNVILLVYESADPQVNRLMLHPAYDASAPNRLGAFNTATNEGRKALQEVVGLLAERWSRQDEKYGRVVGYIVGNEVNSHWFWCNRGRVEMRAFADDYLAAVRTVHRAVRQHAPWPRVYISLDHHWNQSYAGGDDLQSFSGRAFIEYFAQISRDSPEGDFDWHVAYHPYPENLFEPRFWNDKTALPHADAPRITFKNLQVLTDYLQREHLQYAGQPRRVILSEQGFHTPEGAAGEAIQAAAFCYAYRRVEQLDGIDALILHRHVDHPDEGGLLLGLRRRSADASAPHPEKKIYECFRLADTPQWEEAFEFALPIVGLERWPGDRRAN